MRIMALLLCGGMLTGCATSKAPPVSAPLALPASYTNAPAAGEAVPAAWWRGFGDARLDAIVAEALSGAPTIEAAATRLDRARAGVKFADADRLPAGAAEASAAIQQQSLESPTGRIVRLPPGVDRTQQLYGLSGAASWELDLFGRKAAQARAARADLTSARADLAGARLTLAAQATTTYLTVAELGQRLRVQQERNANLARLDGIVSLRAERGVAALVEQDRVRAERQGSLAATQSLEAALETQRNRLAALSGVPPEARGPAPEAIPVPPEARIAALPLDLLRRRPDLVRAERAVAAADARVAAAIAERYPRVTLGALFGVLATAINPLFGADALTASGSATARQTLFDFGRTEAGVDRARAETRLAVANYRQATLDALAEVESAYFDRVARAGERRELVAAEENLARARVRTDLAYKAGAASLIDVLDAERQLLSIRDRLATSRAGEGRAAVSLFRALGGGADAEAKQDDGIPR